MPLYECQQCHHVENTALGPYHQQKFDAYEKGVEPTYTCSLCFTGEWHGKFDRMPAKGWLIDQRGFVWRESEVKHLGKNIQIVGKVE